MDKPTLSEVLSSLNRLTNAVKNHRLNGITIATLNELGDAEEQAEEILSAANFKEEKA